MEWEPCIQGDVLDFDEMFKDRGGIVEPMVAWAAKALLVLDEGFMHTDASELGHFVYRLDAAKKTLVQEPGERDSSCEFCRMLMEEEGYEFEDEEGEPEPPIPAPQWRRKFGELLDYLGDLPKQRWAFETKEDPFIHKWWDLIDLYFQVFGLEEGLAKAQEVGWLTSDEAGVLAPYHLALSRYRDYRKERHDSPLEDVAWAKMCDLAKATRAKLPLVS